MPKYELTIVENNTYTAIVEARSKDEAQAIYDNGLLPMDLNFRGHINGENYVVEVTEVQNA